MLVRFAKFNHSVKQNYSGSKNSTLVAKSKVFQVKPKTFFTSTFLKSAPQNAAAESTVLKGQFGTRENPVLVPSKYSARIVGCTGGPTEEGSHELLWHEVTNFRPHTICLECGQVFKLVKVEGGDHGHGDHGDHGHHH